MIDETQGAAAPATATEQPEAEPAPAALPTPLVVSATTTEADVGTTIHPSDVSAAFARLAGNDAPETFFERVEDEVIRVAEEAAYAVSNLIAAVHNRKPDDGIDAWRTRTGGLHRHPAAKAGE